MVDLNIKPETIKLLEEYNEENVCDLRSGRDFLDTNIMTIKLRKWTKQASSNFKGSYLERDGENK